MVPPLPDWAGLHRDGGALAAESKIDARVFADKAEGQSASFLVVMRERADLAEAEAIADKAEKGRFVYETLRSQAESSQAPVRERLAMLGVPFRSFFLVNMLEVEADHSVALELAGRPDVAAVAANRFAALSPDPLVPATEAFAVPGASRLALDAVEPNLSKIRAPEVWSRGFTGQGIVVGLADTGFSWGHPALKARYRGFDGTAVSHDYNWHDAVHNATAGNPCGSDAASPCDDDGHGTETAGLAVGDGGPGNQIGVAPGARFMGCRNMDQGVGTPARYTECFQFFLAPTDGFSANPRPDLAPHVISNSWGCPPSEGCTDPNILKGVVENVRAAGIFVVVAAGNAGPGCSTISDVPAIYDASFSVGATNLSDAIASFSSRGTVALDGSNRLKPDICAPGVNVRTCAMPNTYRTISGTSASTPQVAGAVALLWSAAPRMVGQPAATADLLRQTAVGLTSTQDCGGLSGAEVPNAVFGFGRLDVAAAALAMPARANLVVPPHHGLARSLAPRQ